MFNKLSTTYQRWQKLYKHKFVIQRNLLYNMSLINSGLPLNKVVAKMNNFASPSLAASWDNVGLLIEPTRPKVISHILLTNDLTEDVMEEAIELKIDLIISYHPPIFVPLKTITTKTWKERIAAMCLENEIALYAPHTSFDSIRGGVNDWLAASFDISSSNAIQVDESGALNGMGRLCTLVNKISLEEAISLVKRRCGLQYLRFARARHTDGLINTVAICAGAGTSVLKGVRADLYVTGEMLHHDVLDAVHCNTSVILTNHSESERGFLKDFQGTLASMLQDCVKVTVSTTDADPLQTV